METEPPTESFRYLRHGLCVLLFAFLPGVRNGTKSRIASVYTFQIYHRLVDSVRTSDHQSRMVCRYLNASRWCIVNYATFPAVADTAVDEADASESNTRRCWGIASMNATDPSVRGQNNVTKGK